MSSRELESICMPLIFRVSHVRECTTSLSACQGSLRFCISSETLRHVVAGTLAISIVTMLQYTASRVLRAGPRSLGSRRGRCVPVTDATRTVSPT